MRQVVITGRCTTNFELRVSTGGVSNCSFTVANNDRKDNGVFMNIKAFGKTAELASEYLSKGSKCLVVGDFSTYEYEKDGVKKYGYEVLANRVEFLDSKKSAGDVPSSDIPQPDPDDYKVPTDGVPF